MTSTLASRTPQYAATCDAKNVIITSMNISASVSPQLGNRPTRMRRDFHFGLEDPLFFPQLFVVSAGHLAVIPYPSCASSHPHYPAWHTPTMSDFELESPHSVLKGMGRISVYLRDTMKERVERLLDEVSSKRIPAAVPDSYNTETVELAKKFKSDPFILQYTFTARMLLASLHRVGTFEETALTFAMCQRVYLELTARISWLQTFESKFVTPNADKIPDPADVVGALCGDQDTANRLLHAGIPVWHVQPIGKKETWNADLWFTYREPTSEVQLRRTGIKFYLNDASPPFPTIYNGSSLTERYRKMGEFIRKCGSTNVYIEETFLDSVPVPGPSQSSSGPIRTTKRRRDRSQVKSA